MDKVDKTLPVQEDEQLNLEDGEISTDEENLMKIRNSLIEIDPTDIKELELVKRNIINLTEQLDKSLFQNGTSDEVDDYSDKLNEKSSIKRHKTKKRKRSRKQYKKSESTSRQSSHLLDLNLYEDIDEYELLGVRGGSPVPESTSSLIEGPSKPVYLISEESSYDSDYEQRTRKMRKLKVRTVCKKKNLDNDKNRNGICISDLRGQCNDDDCTRSHEGRAQRKLEICKFYLSENCSKSDKCSYMHSDFPCKYFYLGMDCINKPTCKFSHGKPLSRNYRQMLLKHIKMAPKEILGTFERIGNDKATELLMKKHAKLCKEYGIDEEKNSLDEPIPSLLDMIIKPPKLFTRTNSITDQDSNSDNNTKSYITEIINFKRDSKENKKNKNANHNSANSYGRNRKTRWTQNELNNKTSAAQKKVQDFVIKQEAQIKQTPKFSAQKSIDKNKFVLNLKLLTNILSTEQIEKLESLGVNNLEQLSQLSLSQLNLMGLTAAQINSIQLNTLNMEKLGILQTPTTDVLISSPLVQENKIFKDDKNNKDDKNDIDGNKADKNDNHDNDENNEMEFEKVEKGFDKDDIEDEEFELCIDESVDTQEENEIDSIDCDKHEEPDLKLNKIISVQTTNSPIKFSPPIISSINDSTNLLNKKVIDISSTVSDMLKEIDNEYIKTPLDVEFLKKINCSSSPINSPKKSVSLYERPSIYDGNPNEAYNIFNNKTDTDMRIIEFIDLTRGDVDLRLPFNPTLDTLNPITEINGSVDLPTKYLLNEIDIPEPNYHKIRNSVQINKNISDPRLRRILCLESLEPKKTDDIELLTPNSPEIEIETETDFSTYISTVLSNDSTAFLPNKSSLNSTAASTTDRKANTDLIEYLQKSQWYKDLNSKDKVMVNQQIALMSSALKKFHLNITPTKVFDPSFILENEFLQKILLNLGIYVDNQGQIKQINSTQICPPTIKQNSFYNSDQQIKPAGLLPTPVSLIEYPNYQLNQNNNGYQDNYNYPYNQNFGNNMNVQPQRFCTMIPNNRPFNYNDQRPNNFELSGRMFNQNQSLNFTGNSYFQPNYDGNNNSFGSVNRRNNNYNDNSQYNNGNNKRRGKFNNQYTRGFNKI